MEILKFFESCKEIVLYGQADYVMRIKSYFGEIYPNIHLIFMEFPPEFYRFDTMVENLDHYDSDLKSLSYKSCIFVLFTEQYNAMAEGHLRKLGFKNLILYGSFIDNELKSIFFPRYFAKRKLKFQMLSDMKSIRENRKICITIYQAKCLSDKKISKEVARTPYMIPIQVGASMTHEKIADLTDDTGDNISYRNLRYSEMTAFYWMWKNDITSDYLGICHYRRLWADLDGIINKLQTVDIDAVLPLPTLCEHSVYEDYMLKYIPTAWQPMMEVLKRLSPEYYEASKKIFDDRIFYASNMCILKRNVLNDLCNWMFPIVAEVEEIVGDIDDSYYNRYAGFCTERLITLYFLYNKNNWKIAHAEKVFIG